MTTVTTNDEFYTNNIVNEQYIYNTVQNDLISSSTSCITSVLTSTCHPSHMHNAQSSRVPNVPALIVEDEKCITGEKLEIQGGTNAFSAEKGNGANNNINVLPTPPVTPATAWEKLVVTSSCSKLDNSGATETTSLPHENGPGLSNHASSEQIGLSTTESYIKPLNGETESYFAPRLSLPSVSPHSSQAATKWALLTPGDDSDGYYTSTSSGSSAIRGSPSPSISSSHSSEDLETYSSKFSTPSQSSSVSDLCSSTSPSSTASIDISSTTHTSSSPILPYDNDKRKARSVSSHSKYEKYVPPPPGTFTSCCTNMLRSEVQAQLLSQAQRKIFVSEENVTEGKSAVEATKALLSAVQNHPIISQATSMNPDYQSTDFADTKKRKFKDTSKWSTTRRISRFLLKTEREIFWPYTTLGIAKLDCFGAGIDNYIRHLEDENQLLKAKEKLDWPRERFVRTDSEEENANSGPEM